MISGKPCLLIVNSDQIQRAVVRLNRYSFLSQNSDLLVSKKARNRLFGFGHVLVVAQAAENTIRRLESRQLLHHRSLSCGIVGEEVAGQRHQVPLQLVGYRNVSANFLGAHEGADVEIGELDNAETFEGLRQAPEPDPPIGGFKVEPAIEEPIGASNKGGSA